MCVYWRALALIYILRNQKVSRGFARVVLELGNALSQCSLHLSVSLRCELGQQTEIKASL